VIPTTLRDGDDFRVLCQEIHGRWTKKTALSVMIMMKVARYGTRFGFALKKPKWSKRLFRGVDRRYQYMERVLVFSWNSLARDFANRRIPTTTV
jgi:hypothetical protein